MTDEAGPNPPRNPNRAGMPKQARTPSQDGKPGRPRGATLPRIKVCGLTRPDEARAAVRAGADAIGLVCHAPSPRSVDAEQAAAIVAAAGPGALAVAVMVQTDPKAALAWMERTGTLALQLCGPARPETWRGFPHPLLRRVPVGPGGVEEMEAWQGTASLFVLDHPAAPGGTGLGVELETAAAMAAVAPCLLAGGLDETNVAHRVAAVRPWGVDASSRLERAPGRKDTARVSAFVQAAATALRASGVKP